MRAVNLIPSDARRGGSGDIRSLRGPGSAVVGLLGVVLILVTLYVLASNSVSQRTAQLASLQQQVTQAQAEAAQLNGYTQFAKLAQARVQTVKEIASGRFNWQQALSDLSRVVPANTSLSSLAATVNPGAGTAGGSSSGSLRGAISAPAFELQGCTATQDDVARLMSRLRLIRGVTRVTLSHAVKSAAGAAGTPVTSGSGSTGGCAATAPTFDLVVFFEPLPTVAAAPTGTTAPAGTTGTATPTAATASTTPGSTR
jgi:Tfp pilus assembly protein PilN